MKSKKFLTILLSLAIMFTFMPAMAFASEPAPAKWEFAPNYETVFVEGYGTVPDYTYNTVRVYGSDGAIHVFADPATDVSWTVPTEAQVGTKYYDLSNAEFATANGTTLKAEYNNGQYTKSSVTYLKLNVPSYAKNATKKYSDTYDVPATEKYVTIASLKTDSNWDATVTGDEKYVSTKKDEQSFAISMSGTFVGAKKAPFIYGNVASKAVKVLAAAKTPDDAKYFFDDAEGLTQSPSADHYTIQYDGAAHTLMVSPIAGWTPEFYVLDPATGGDIKGTVTLTDRQKNDVAVTVKWTKDGDKTPTESKTKTIYVNVAAAYKVGFGFVDGDKAATGTYGPEYYVTGSEYDAWKYLEFAPALASKKDVQSSWTEAYTKWYLSLSESNTKAANANAATLLEAFKAYYDIEATSSKYTPNKVSLAFDAKTLSADEKDALAKKYDQLFRNFGVANIAGLINNSRTTAVVYLNSTGNDYEVTFTKAITSKTYKGKKFIKKAKLKKNQTIQFTAEAANGAAVVYKLVGVNTSKIKIDKNTGKLTLKKGLAKGTYKFKIKAYVPEVQDNKNASEVQSVKIVVKKK